MISASAKKLMLLHSSVYFFYVLFSLSPLIRSDDPNFVTEVGNLENANETLQPRLSSSYVNAQWKTEIHRVPGNSMDTWDGKMQVAQLRGL